jgi:hypothetical protein
MTLPNLICVPSLDNTSKSFNQQDEIVQQTGKSSLTITCVKHFEHSHSCSDREPES